MKQGNKERITRTKKFTSEEIWGQWVDALLSISFVSLIAVVGFLLLRLALSMPSLIPVMIVVGIAFLLAIRLAVSGGGKGDELIDCIEREAIEVSALIEESAGLSDSGDRIAALLADIGRNARVEHEEIQRIDRQVKTLKKAELVDFVEQLTLERKVRYDVLLDAYSSIQKARTEVRKLAAGRNSMAEALGGDGRCSLEEAIKAMEEECDFARRVSERLRGDTVQASESTTEMPSARQEQPA